MRTSRRATLVLMTLVGAAACSDPPGEPGPSCPTGHAIHGAACAPVFEPCAEDELPVLGGGCAAVGPTECATPSFTRDGSSCAPVVPPAPCAPGTRLELGSTTCLPVGVADCGPGGAPDGEDGCVPILPDTECPPGTLAAPGDATCLALDHCGDAPWGDLPPGEPTRYVDGAYGGGDGDGSETRPFPTLGAALSAADAGDRIVVAEGDYEEALVLTQPVHLRGRCASRVTLRRPAAAGEGPVIDVQASATGASIQGLSITGLHSGVEVNGAQGVRLANLEIHDTGSFGLELRSATDVRVERVAIRRTRNSGVLSDGSTVTLEGVTVRGTNHQAGVGGEGIFAQCATPTRCGLVEVSGSWIVDNTRIGVVAWGANLVLRDSVVADTRLTPDNDFGVGVQGECDTDWDLCPALTIRRSVLTRNRDAAVVLWGADAVIEDVVLEHTESGGQPLSGEGLFAMCDPTTGRCGELEISRSVVRHNRHIGVTFSGATLALVDSVVRDTRTSPGGGHGGGMEIQQPSTDQADPPLCAVSLQTSVVARNRRAGVVTFGREVCLDRVHVQDTTPDDTGVGGFGVAGMRSEDRTLPARLLLDDCVIARNVDSNVFVEGSEVVVTASWVTDMRNAPETLPLGAIMAQCDPTTGACSDVVVHQSLVSDNEFTGVKAVGGSLLLTESTVRDTWPIANHPGAGVLALCYPPTRQCAVVTVQTSLLQGNAVAGLYSGGGTVTFEESIVRDGRPDRSRRLGRGVNAECSLEATDCGTLALVRTLVANNRDMGVYIAGVPTTFDGVHVRDTQRRDSNGGYGHGIEASCDEPDQGCMDVQLRDTWISGAHTAGLLAYGVSALLESCRIDGVETSTTDDEQLGALLAAVCPEGDSCAGQRLEIRRSALTDGQITGLQVHGVPGSLERSLVARIAASAADGTYGYGIQIHSDADQPVPTFDVRECRVQDALLAGVFYGRAGGVLETSWISDGAYPVALNTNSVPTIRGDNTLDGEISDEPTFVNMDPSPTPAPADPIAAAP